VDTLSAIAQPNRRRIVQLLARRGNLSASEIAGHFECSGPAISQHLQVLKDSKTVSVTRQAQKRIYSLNPESLREVSAWLFDITNQWEQRLDKLQSLLTKEKNKTSAPPGSPSQKGIR
jgi:DNA-binding transcriptional ArsR family regulator